jgi:hypothetical protein
LRRFRLRALTSVGPSSDDPVVWLRRYHERHPLYSDPILSVL